MVTVSNLSYEQRDAFYEKAFIYIYVPYLHFGDIIEVQIIHMYMSLIFIERIQVKLK